MTLIIQLIDDPLHPCPSFLGTTTRTLPILHSHYLSNGLFDTRGKSHPSRITFFRSMTAFSLVPGRVCRRSMCRIPEAWANQLNENNAHFHIKLLSDAFPVPLFLLYCTCVQIYVLGMLRFGVLLTIIPISYSYNLSPGCRCGTGWQRSSLVQFSAQSFDLQQRNPFISSFPKFIFLIITYQFII